MSTPSSQQVDSRPTATSFPLPAPTHALDPESSSPSDNLSMLRILPDVYQEISPQLLWKLETFTCFPKLPVELRLMIWKMTLPGPRLVNINPLLCKETSVYLGGRKSFSLCKRPGINRESEKVMLDHFSYVPFPEHHFSYLPFAQLQAVDAKQKSFVQQCLPLVRLSATHDFLYATWDILVESSHLFDGWEEASWRHKVQCFEIRDVIIENDEMAHLGRVFAFFDELKELHLVDWNPGRYDFVWSGTYAEDVGYLFEDIIDEFERNRSSPERQPPRIYLHLPRKLRTMSREERKESFWAIHPIEQAD